MLDHEDAHIGVYQLLDGVLAGLAVPPGAKGAMFSIIDGMRAGCAPVDDVRRAENVAIEIHKLEAALQGSDASAAQAARDALKSLAAAWLQARICTQH